MIDTRKQMEWIQHNRTPRVRTQRLDDLIEEFTRQVRVVDAELLSAAAALASEVIDPDLQPHCRVASIRGGLLTIHVDQPALLYALRVRCGAALERRLGASRRVGGARRVSFQWGMDGMPLKDA